MVSMGESNGLFPEILNQSYFKSELPLKLIQRMKK